MTQLTTAYVMQLARLSRLALDEQAAARYASQLSAVAEYVDRLQSVPGKPTETVGTVNQLGDDIRREQPLLSPEQVLAAAPRSKNRAFVVRPVLAGQEESA